MSEVDVLRALVDGRLRMCDAAGCSNTFEPKRAQRYCRQPDCARVMRPCYGPWCDERVPRALGQQGKGKREAFCSDECRENYSRKLKLAPTPEQAVVLRGAMERMERLNGAAKLSERFAAVHEAVRERNPGKAYEALVDAGAACLEAASRRGPS